MDDRHFDEITRSLTSGASRRGILKRAGALAVGAVVGVAGFRSGVGAQTTCTCERGVQTCRTVTTTTTEETRTRSGRQACQIGQSGQTGTQAGTFTDTFEVVTTTTTTQRYRGCGNQNNPIGQPETTSTTERTLIDTTFEPTGPCNAGRG
jgi:hypothetical protein